MREERWKQYHLCNLKIHTHKTARWDFKHNYKQNCIKDAKSCHWWGKGGGHQRGGWSHRAGRGLEPTTMMLVDELRLPKAGKEKVFWICYNRHGFVL
jgi:hypothetical protein